MAYRGSILTIIFGIASMGWSQISTSDEPLPTIILVLGIFAFIVGIVSLIIDVRKVEKKKKEPKPICEFCGYVALDERELHNHQITCEKKN